MTTAQFEATMRQATLHNCPYFSVAEHGFYIHRFRDRQWEFGLINEDLELQEWRIDHGFDPSLCNVFVNQSVQLEDNLLLQQQVVSAALKEYDRRVGYRELGKVTHFEWIDSTSFWVYKLRQRESADFGRYDRYLERRSLQISKSWDKNKEWELIEVSSVDLCKLRPVDELVDEPRLIMSRWPSLLVFSLLELLWASDYPLNRNTERLIENQSLPLAEYLERHKPSPVPDRLLDYYPELKSEPATQHALVLSAISHIR